MITERLRTLGFVDKRHQVQNGTGDCDERSRTTSGWSVSGEKGAVAGANATPGTGNSTSLDDSATAQLRRVATFVRSGADLAAPATRSRKRCLQSAREYPTARSAANRPASSGFERGRGSARIAADKGVVGRTSRHRSGYGFRGDAVH